MQRCLWVGRISRKECRFCENYLSGLSRCYNFALACPLYFISLLWWHRFAYLNSHYGYITWAYHGDSNHWQPVGLFRSLFRLTTKETSKLWTAGSMWKESIRFPFQRASYIESVSMSLWTPQWSMTAYIVYCDFHMIWIYTCLQTLVSSVV